MSASTLPILHLSFPPHDQPITSLLPATLLASQPSTTVITPDQLHTLSSLPSPSFSALVSSPPSSSALPSAELLKHVYRVLVAGAPVVVGLSDVAAAGQLQTTMVLSGFTAVDRRSVGALVVLEAAKPVWSAGASAKLSFARKAATLAVTTTAPVTAAASTWNLSGGALAEDDVMVDEDELLARETERVAVKAKAVSSDCGTAGPGAKRKACKNCTCGLAEELSVEERGAVVATTSASKSACGNCSLGDAFRCASCPFLGQPAFVNNKVGGGAVKLAL